MCIWGQRLRPLVVHQGSSTAIAPQSRTGDCPQDPEAERYYGGREQIGRCAAVSTACTGYPVVRFAVLLTCDEGTNATRHFRSIAGVPALDMGMPIAAEHLAVRNRTQSGGPAYRRRK